jgi:hypothetical protein
MRLMAMASLLCLFACDSDKASPAPAAADDAQTAPTQPADASPPPIDASLPDAEAPDAAKKAAANDDRAPDESAVREAISNTAMLKMMTGDSGTYRKTEDTEQGASLDDSLSSVKRRGAKVSSGPPSPEGPVSRVKANVDAIDDSTLEEDMVLRRIRSRYLAGIKRCHLSRLKVDPAAGGRVRARLTIGKTGRVTTSVVKGFEASVDRCIKGQALKWRFGIPKDEEGNPIAAQFQLVLLLKPGS